MPKIRYLASGSGRARRPTRRGVADLADQEPHRRVLTKSHTAEFFYELPISLSALASLPQPDGVGVWAEGSREIAFMLEYDTGSEHLAQVTLPAHAATRIAGQPPQPKPKEDAIDSAPLTISQLARLPVTIDLITAAKILGIGRTKAYELTRHGEFPCLVIRVGDLYRVSTSDLLRLLGTSRAEIHPSPTAA